MRVLIIEDDLETVESVSMALQIPWPEAEILSARLGKKGIEVAKSEAPDIIILDLGLPDISGFEVLERVRLSEPVPIIVLTVSGEEASIVRGLGEGADDYIVKPCGHLELLARVKARIRDKDRSGGKSPLFFGPLSFNPSRRRLLNGGKELNLTGIQARIIHCLMRKRGSVATCSGLARAVWGDDYPGSTYSLRVHIRHLRQKVEADPSHPQLILTKRGIGYFVAKPGEPDRSGPMKHHAMEEV